LEVGVVEIWEQDKDVGSVGADYSEQTSALFQQIIVPNPNA